LEVIELKGLAGLLEEVRIDFPDVGMAQAELVEFLPLAERVLLVPEPHREWDWTTPPT
jgi:hypothetical protein